jgi:hypothetical protein
MIDRAIGRVFSETDNGPACRPECALLNGASF